MNKMIFEKKITNEINDLLAFFLLDDVWHLDLVFENFHKFEKKLSKTFVVHGTITTIYFKIYFVSI